MPFFHHFLYSFYSLIYLHAMSTITSHFGHSHFCHFTHSLSRILSPFIISMNFVDDLQLHMYPTSWQSSPSCIPSPFWWQHLILVQLTSLSVLHLTFNWFTHSFIYLHSKTLTTYNKPYTQAKKATTAALTGVL